VDDEFCLILMAINLQIFRKLVFKNRDEDSEKILYLDRDFDKIALLMSWRIGEIVFVNAKSICFPRKRKMRQKKPFDAFFYNKKLLFQYKINRLKFLRIRPNHQLKFTRFSPVIEIIVIKFQIIH
jgi:hypothetical protein